MAVYVDDGRYPFRRYVMCHMIADTQPELLAMADRIGVQRRWLQHPGQATEHFDICQKKRARAVYFGAIPIRKRELVQRLRARRELEKRCPSATPATTPASSALNAGTQTATASAKTALGI